MTWQSVAEAAVTRYVPDAAVRDLVLAEIRGTQRSPDLRTRGHEIAFEAVGQRRLPGLFAERWPAYRRWYEQDGDGARPSLEEAAAALERHMPELVPIWSALVRNYDYDPNLFDAVVSETRFAGTRVIGMADQLWGLLDGVNGRGLAVSFTFGGRRCAGRGFSVPIVVRYLLETCATVAEGVAALERLPVQAAYNVTLVDREAHHATIWLAPGEPARVTADRTTTNHQGVVDWPEYARWTRTEERLDRLDGLLALGADGVIAGLLDPPMRRTDYDGGFGTLYTALYRPDAGTVTYHWPGASWNQSLEDFRHERFVAEIGDA